MFIIVLAFKKFFVSGLASQMMKNKLKKLEKNKTFYTSLCIPLFKFYIFFDSLKIYWFL